MEYIKRAIEDLVKESANNFKAVLVTGARQTGKSTLLEHLYPEIKEISFDDPFAEEQAKNNPETLANGAMSGEIFETFVISEILKSYSNRGLDYRYFVSYYRGKDKIRKKKNGDIVREEAEIDFIIEENGVLYPIEIKLNATVTADMTAAFRVLDDLPEKKRGMGAVVCMCPMPGMLRENVLQIPCWYV